MVGLILPHKTISWAAGGSYTETGVVADANDWIDASGAYPSNIKSALLFASFVTDHVSTRQALSHWNNGGSSANIFHADYNASTGTTAVRFDMEDDQGNSILLSITHSGDTDRLHALVDVYQDGTGLYGRMALWDETNAQSAGSWATTSASDTTNALAGNLQLGLATAPRLFAEIAGVPNQAFDGTCYRNAMWMSTTGSAIADATAAGTQNNFTNGLNLIDVATARTAYGSHSRAYDLEGAASNYNLSGGDAGGDTALTWTTTGTFA